MLTLNYRRSLELFTTSHEPIRPNLCVICRKIELPPNKSVCDKCFVERCGTTPEKLMKYRQGAERELKQLERQATPWGPTSGHYGLSGAAALLDMTQRGLQKAIRRLGLQPIYDHHHVQVSIPQYETIKQNTRGHYGYIVCQKWDDGTVKITTKEAGMIIEDRRDGLNTLARTGAVSGFLVSLPLYGGFVKGQWRIDAVALAEYLVNQGRHEDARRLLEHISRLYPNFGVPTVPGHFSDQPRIQLGETQSSAAGYVGGSLVGRKP